MTNHANFLEAVKVSPKISVKRPNLNAFLRKNLDYTYYSRPNRIQKYFVKPHVYSLSFSKKKQSLQKALVYMPEAEPIFSLRLYNEYLDS